ncbi:MAG TPA: TadA family conjugal transfer-associated ATPase [Jatrophihabitans sp.]|jgi:pilus assembly protein CpaF
MSPPSAGAGRQPLLDRVRLRIAAGADGVELAELARQESDLVLDSVVLDELSGQLAADLSGAGPLEDLIALPGVTDVLVNAHDEVWIDQGGGLQRVPIRFSSDAAVRQLAVRLAAQAGRRLDDATPFVDAVLPDGTRLHAVLPPVACRPSISLRVLARRRLSLADLVAMKAMSAALADLLHALVAARLTVLISGGTGSGKTTLLAAMLGRVGEGERIITVEDAAELAIVHPHVVSLVARAANLEQAGAVGLRELVRQALRMRVDRLVVGEFRGAEIVELLTALNTGHSGGAATVHANSVRDVPARLVALAALGGMSADVVAAQAGSAVDVLLHVHRTRAGRRELDQVAMWPASAGQPPSLVWTATSGLGPGAAELAARLVAAEVEVPALLARTAP